MYKVYYPDGRMAIFHKISEVAEQIVYYNAIGYIKIKN